MNTVDRTIDRAADWLQEQANAFAGAENGLKAKLAPQLADDAAFLRKLKPSLIAARARGEAPTSQRPGSDTIAPSGPQLGAHPKQPKKRGGPNPWLVAGTALVAGIALAKWIDWRGHAHPRA